MTKHKKIINDDEEIVLPRLRKKKVRLRKWALIVILIFFVVLGLYSGINVVMWHIDAKHTEETIEGINEIVTVEEVEDTENTVIVNEEEYESVDASNPYWDYIKMNLINVDFTELKNTNSDTVAWIQVNGTNINYPVVQTTDNKYYLKKDFNKKSNSAGWVFMDYRNSVTTLDKNTIIYAHGRVDGTMFGSLKNIMNSNWYSDVNNHVLKISTEYTNTLWQVFSVYIVPTTSDYLQVDFRTDNEYLMFLNMLKDRSDYEFDTTLSSNDYIVTLSTCYETDKRVVLHAKLIKMEEK